MKHGSDRQQGVIKNALELSHQYIREIVRPGDRVVDATAGNGGDTCFLADLAGDAGHVDAFDIQAAALAKTSLNLSAAGLSGRCTLHLASHDHSRTAAGAGSAPARRHRHRRVILRGRQRLCRTGCRFGLAERSRCPSVCHPENRNDQSGRLPADFYLSGETGLNSSFAASGCFSRIAAARRSDLDPAALSSRLLS